MCLLSRLFTSDLNITGLLFNQDVLFFIVIQRLANQCRKFLQESHYILHLPP
jgi:hypothetical protein